MKLRPNLNKNYCMHKHFFVSENMSVNCMLPNNQTTYCDDLETHIISCPHTFLYNILIFKIKMCKTMITFSYDQPKLHQY